MAAPPPRLPLFLMPPAVEPDSSNPKPARGRKPGKVKAPPPPPHNKKEKKRGMSMHDLERLRLAREAEARYSQIIQTDPFNQNQNLNQPSLGPLWINPHSLGAPDRKVRVSSSASVFETSSNDYTPSWDFCFKKKKMKNKKKFINGDDQCTVYKEKKQPFSEMSMTNLQGLNLQNKFQFYDQKRAGFNSRAPRSAFYSNNTTLSGGAEVVAVHRKINPKSGRNVLMEYEFFPDDSKNDTVFKETTRFQNPNYPAESSSAPSCLTTNFDYSASNSVDLSLKLSF